MQLPEASAFVKTFKGAALSCLILMWAVRHRRRNWTRDDLARLTGWSRETVADGLSQLELQGLAVRVGRYQWQLTDVGFQLSFDQRGVEKIDSGATAARPYPTLGVEKIDSNPTLGVDKIDSGSSSFKESHDHGHDHGLKLPLPPSGVEKIDSPAFRDSISAGLADQLIRCGSSPMNASDAIRQALATGAGPKEIELRILWWRVYCLAHKSIQHPGNLIAARVGQGHDKPDDFGLNEIPDKYFDFRQELEDLEREVERARQNGSGPEQ